MAKLGEAHVIITASLKPLKAALRKARMLVTSAMKKIASIIKKAALAIAAALTAAIFAASKFQKQLAFVSTMLDRQTLPLMKEYEKALMQMAVQFGESTATLSTGLYDILSASIAADKALEVLKVASTAAVAGMTDTKIAADALTTIINAFAMSADDATMISDKLFATVKRGKTTFPELASAIGRVASTAAIAGLSLDELLASIATLTRAGINTNEAVTAMNGVLRAFLKPSSDAIKTAKEFGLELSSNTLRTIGFSGAVQKLNKASAEQLAQIIPRIRGLKALAAALKNQAGLQFDLKLISQESAGRAAEAYAKMANTFSFQFGRIKEVLLNTFRLIGKPIAEVLQGFIKLRVEGIGGLNNWLEKNQSVIKKWADVVVSQVQRVLGFFDQFIPRAAAEPEPAKDPDARREARKARLESRRAGRRAKMAKPRPISKQQQRRDKITKARFARPQEERTPLADFGKKALVVIDPIIDKIRAKLESIPFFKVLIEELQTMPIVIQEFTDTLNASMKPVKKDLKEMVELLKAGDFGGAFGKLKDSITSALTIAWDTVSPKLIGIAKRMADAFTGKIAEKFPTLMMIEKARQNSVEILAKAIGSVLKIDTSPSSPKGFSGDNALNEMVKDIIKNKLALPTFPANGATGGVNGGNGNGFMEELKKTAIAFLEMSKILRESILIGGSFDFPLPVNIVNDDVKDTVK